MDRSGTPGTTLVDVAELAASLPLGTIVERCRHWSCYLQHYRSRFVPPWRGVPQWKASAVRNHRSLVIRWSLGRLCLERAQAEWGRLRAR